MSLFVGSLTGKEESQLRSVAHNGPDVKFARRAQVILASSRGIPVKRIAEVLGYTEVQVRRIINCFRRGRVEGLRPHYRGGRPPTFTPEQRHAVVELVEARPRDLGYPLSQWSLSTLQAVLIREKKVRSISRPTIRSILIEAGFTKQRTKTWKESYDRRYNKKNS